MQEDKYLGKQVEYVQHYSPEILVAVPRQINRSDYHLLEDSLPFTGCDVWHAYELSFLTEKGLPVCGLLKVIYPCNNPSIVESKSFKLYLNSFNMHRFGKSAKEGINHVLMLIKKDLGELLQTSVDVNFFSALDDNNSFDFSDYQLLEAMPDTEGLIFEHYTEEPKLLIKSEDAATSIKVATHLLRSNCKITHQPDWGSAFIYLKGKTMPDLKGLTKYLVSIRNENHFHEEICEMIYKRLWDKFCPEELTVTCIYTRRGGIDICPTRASQNHLLPQHLTNPKELSSKLLRQ